MREIARDDVDAEVDRILQFLRILILRSGKTYLQVAEEAGLKVTVLAVILRGDRPLKVREVLAILRAVGMTPEAFYLELYGDPGPRTELPSGKKRPRPVQAGAEGVV